MNEADYWRALRGALRNLYDHTTLRRNPLYYLLPADDHPHGLQGVLLDAVQSLSPQRDASLQSDARRTHQILLHRYVEQFSQGEVADSLGLGARQLRRQEQMAIRSLGEYLRGRYALEIVAQSEEQADGADEQESESIGEASEETYREDLAWLHQSAPPESIALEELVDGVLGTLAPVLDELHITLARQRTPASPRVQVNTMTARQAIMITLSTIARLTTVDTMRISTRIDRENAVLEIQADASDVELERGEGLLMASRLLAISQGALTVASDNPRTMQVAVSLPLARQSTILIIDDNQDAGQLVQRFLTGSRYHAVITRDPVEGLALAQQISPQMILLDVMLPGMDGWGVLARLRRHPVTEHIPVVICTILPEEEMARSLGASGFLRKPMSREELLSVLGED